jgi:acetylornithine deacetylase/succinyl-diaminopimelate desuccinylase-like protein
VEPAELLQRLIRFDTTNPPGNEAAVMGFLDGLLREAGLQTRLLESVPGRPNLIVRVPGAGTAPPLLMQAHLDVVPADPHSWTHPPFEGRIADGFIWGRGALDMKAGAAMMVTALLRGQAEGRTPPGDVVLALVADEEGGGDHGARFLVEQHPELFSGVRYAIGEFGGFTQDFAGTRLAPVQVAEKQFCTVRATIRGSGGHGSLILKDGVSARLGAVLSRLTGSTLPVHVTPVIRTMITSIAEALSGPPSWFAPLLLQPRLTNGILRVLGEQGANLSPMFRNTATPNIVSSGDKVNVQPTQAEVVIDGRVLPGFGPDDLIGELRALLGPGVEFEVERFDPVPAEVDLALMPVIAAALRSHDPSLKPVPMLLPASTDGRHFSRLGIQSYGFTPMVLPSSMRFITLVHGVDERIPVEAVDMGTRCIEALLQSFGDAA